MNINAQDSAKIRTDLECIQNISYGPTLMERLDFFPVATKHAPLIIFHHGGAWTRFNKNQCSYIAPPFVTAGINVLVLDFASAPQVSLDEIIRQNRAAVAWAWHSADKYGWDRNKIHCIGHSSGGHISSMMLTTDWEGDYGLSLDVIRALPLAVAYTSWSQLGSATGIPT
jgi:arylformamidase